MATSFALDIDQYVGIVHTQAIIDLVNKTISEHGLKASLVCFYDNKIFFSIEDDDADLMGACVNEIGRRVHNYIEENCPETN